jgi:hypothetical protein
MTYQNLVIKFCGTASKVSGETENTYRIVSFKSLIFLGLMLDTSVVKGPAALRLIVQPCDEDEFYRFSV